MSVSKPPVNVAPTGEAVGRRASNGADSRRVYTAKGILRYDDKQGLCGKLLGLITFTDGKSLKVWDADLHATCRQFAQYPIGEVRYTFKHSDTWGDSLATIERDQADHDLYDQMREADEQRGRVAPNSWLGRKIRDSVGRRMPKAG